MITFIKNAFKKNSLINATVIQILEVTPLQTDTLNDPQFFTVGIIQSVKKNGNLIVTINNQHGEYARLNPNGGIYQNVIDPNECVLVR